MENTSKKQSRKRHITIIVTILVLIILISLPFLLQKDKITYVSPAIPYNTDITKTISYTGVLDCENSQVVSFSDRFFCEDVYVKNGEKVKKGDKLFKGYTISLTGSVASSQEYFADFDGIITTLNASKGEGVSAVPVCVIKDTSSPKVTFLVNKYDREVLEQDQKAEVEIFGYRYEGKVSFVGNNFESIASQNGTTSGIYAEISLENKQGKEIKIITGDESSEDLKTENGPLLSDVFITNAEVDVTVITKTAKDVLSVPVSAVKSDKDGDYCFIIDVNNKAQKFYITLGISDDTNYEVKSGLTKNERVINNPSSKIAVGDTVLEK